ncbi:MAG: hypothetical protein ACRD47_06275 [Nitrososphaeraceae archaeon]
MLKSKLRTALNELEKNASSRLAKTNEVQQKVPALDLAVLGNQYAINNFKNVILLICRWERIANRLVVSGVTHVTSVLNQIPLASIRLTITAVKEIIAAGNSFARLKEWWKRMSRNASNKGMEKAARTSDEVLDTYAMINLLYARDTTLHGEKVDWIETYNINNVQVVKVRDLSLLAAPCVNIT